MLSVKATFNDRVKEIDIYYNFLDSHLSSAADEDLKKILKSNLILMLYNLVESSISNAIEEIHIDIHRNFVSFNILKSELKKVLIRFLKSEKGPSPDNFILHMSDIAIDIVKRCFKKQKISNGNIDNYSIRDLGKNYGFNSNTTYSLTRNGLCLADIRGRRNDLAHGTFSFTEVGKEYSIEDLKKMKDETFNYLTEIIHNIDSYLKNQDYKQTA